TWRGRGEREEWAEDSLFPTTNAASLTLTGVIETLSEIPEVQLGTEQVGRFSPERVARITTAWVNGASLSELADAEYDSDLLECARHVYGVITGDVSWGLRAIQRVAFAGRAEAPADAEMDVAPAMIFHGVRTREALALRMLGVP